MHLRVGRDLDVEMVAGLLADERHQVAGVPELAGSAIAAGQVAAQRDDATQPCGLELGQLFAHARRARADAGVVRRRLDLLGLDRAHRGQRAVLRATARTVGH